MDREFERYLEYQSAQRARRVETLGTAVTALVLSTVDLGVSPLNEPEFRPPTHHTVEHTTSAEVTPAVVMRQQRLGQFATESAELGYATAA